MSTTNQQADQQQFPGQVQGDQRVAPRSQRSRPSKPRRGGNLKKVLGNALVIAALISAVSGIIIAVLYNWQPWFKQDNHPEPTIVATATGQSPPTLTPIPLPSITITSPIEGSKVSRLVTVTGTASHIPQDEHLWILVQPVGTSLYFPQPGPVEVSVNDGTWTWGAFVGKPSDSGEFVLYAALADPDGSAAIEANLQANKGLPPESDFEPLNSLQGIQLITHVTVVRL